MSSVAAPRRPRSIRGNVWWLALAATALAVGGCSPRACRSTCAGAWSAAAVPTAVSELVGAGDMQVTVEGGTLRLSLGLRRHADGRFECDIYGPLGGRAASIAADSGGGTITAGEEQRPYRLSDPLGEVAGLGVFPFSFADLVRILCGEYAGAHVPDGVADTLECAGRRVVARWQRGGLRVACRTAGRRCLLESITYGPAAGSPWVLRLAAVERGRPMDIGFRADENNYFRIRYRRLGSPGDERTEPR